MSKNSNVKPNKPDTQQMMIDNAEYLKSLMPETVQTIASLIGIEQAMIVVEALAGLDYLMPKTLGSNTGKQLVALVGPKATQKLIAYFGGSYVYIPFCTALRRTLFNQAFFNAVMTKMETGISQYKAVREVSHSFGIAERTGYAILKKFSQKRQPDLFDTL